MLAIELRFPAGRYHATPWDRQVNEGTVEWPPSPWRILRALIATWYLKSQEDISETAMCKLVEKLSSLPRFHLPKAALGHTRHYMPLYRSALDDKNTKVFDTFVALKDDYKLLVIWQEVDLSDDEKNILSRLLIKMGYLGRAESWVDARIVENSVFDANSMPLQNGSALPDGYEIVRTLTCILPEEYRLWRNETLKDHKDSKLRELQIAAREKGKPANMVKLGKKDLIKIDQNLPTDLFQALHADTGDLKGAGWSQPPGSQWVNYIRPRNCFDINPRTRARRSTKELPIVARFAVTSQAPPRLTDAIYLSEKIHLALVKRSDGSRVFTGCDESGGPLKGNRHAYIMCESNLGLSSGRRGEITHVTIYAPLGFDIRERKALDGLTKLWGHDGHDIQLVLLGVGQPEDFAGLDEAAGACPLLVESRIWISRTPFVSTRHPKVTRTKMPKLDTNGLQIGSSEHELRRLLDQAGLPCPSSVERTASTDLAGHETRWLSFKRERNRGEGRRDATGFGYGFRIEFPEAVRGPIALGYGAHFGLGLFVPESP